ncbi:MAG: arginine deiminase-related protein [Planctomycetota bacterium]|nr:arginine deiminase-related protein [Planctomycetota bacterium]
MRPSFLMCRPTFYGINYQINPWMNVHRQANRALALQQWLALRCVLEEEFGAAVAVCRARAGLPDMTFAANAGLVCGETFIPSRFRYRERAGEEPFFTAWFRRRGYRIAALAGEHRFEGAGDALFLGGNLFAGYYFRTDIQTHARLGELLGVRVYSLELVRPRFYHLDTCFAPLGASAAVYYPDAFDSYSIRVLKEHADDLIAVRHDEAYEFGCNAVVIGKKVVIAEPCRELARALRRRGYAVYRLKFSEFIKAGGAAKCLTLQLDQGPAAAPRR